MQTTDLKFPGGFTHAKTIRREVAHTISQIEIAVQQGSTVDPAFGDFLADAAAKTPGNALGSYVANGATVNVENSAGNLDSPATAVVAGGTLTSVKLGATKTIATNAQVVTVTDTSGGPNVPAVANVAAGVLTNVALTTTTDAIVRSTDATVIQNSGGTTVASAGVTAIVSGGGMVAARLSAAQAIVANTVKTPVGTVSGSGTFGTFTVVGGVITGIVLSAS